MIKKSFILLTLILMINISYGAYNYNENYTNLYLDSNSWCANMDIIFTIYDQTDYENKRDIEDNLCKPGCTDDCDGEDGCFECKDDCTKWNYIDGATIKIYDGPLTSRPLLLDTTTNSTGQVSLKLDRPEQYLVEIFPDGEYNDYHDLFQLYECNFAQDTTIKELNEAENQTEPEDYTFTYDTIGATLEIKQTTSNETTDFNIDDSITLAVPLNHTTKSFELTSETANFTSITMKININREQQSTIKLNKYNPTSKSWSNMKFNDLGGQISFDATSLGIYAITQEPIIVEDPIIEELPQEEPENASEDITTQSDTNTTTSGKLNSKTLIGGGVAAIAIIGLIILLLAKKGKNNTHYHDDRNKAAPPEEHKEVLTTYEATYKQAKTYIQEYKDKYGKDQLYRALEKANVPKDIIDKVINEEYE